MKEQIFNFLQALYNDDLNKKDFNQLTTAAFRLNN